MNAETLRYRPPWEVTINGIRSNLNPLLLVSSLMVTVGCPPNEQAASTSTDETATFTTGNKTTENGLTENNTSPPTTSGATTTIDSDVTSLGSNGGSRGMETSGTTTIFTTSETGQTIDTVTDTTITESSTTEASTTAMEASTTEVTNTTGSGCEPKELSIIYKGNPEKAILIAGRTHQWVSNVLLSGSTQDYLIEILTMSNDMEGVFGDNPEPTLAVKQVCIEYEDSNQNPKVDCGAFDANGEVAFKGLDFLVPQGAEAALKTTVDLNSMEEVGPALSGEKLRIGLKTKGNSDSTFQAIGQNDKNVVNLDEANCVDVINPNSVPDFVVRQTKINFEDTPQSSVLSNAVLNPLKNLELQAEPESVAYVGRLVYNLKLNKTEGSEMRLGNFLIAKNGCDWINPLNANFRTSTGLNVGENTGQWVTEDDQVIVSFNEPLVVPNGGKLNLNLCAAPEKVQSYDQVITALANGDQTVELEGLTANNHPNTGTVYVLNDPTRGIFHGENSDFSSKLESGKDIIWSDLSGFFNIHYPTVVNGAVFNESGSNDFTNGYLLGSDKLQPHVLEN